MTFNLNEADLPEVIMKQMRVDCEFEFYQDSVKRAIEDTTVRLEHLLTNHTWAQHEIDDEGFVRLDLIIGTLGQMWTNAGAHGPRPSYSLIAWVFIYDTSGICMPWISLTPQSLQA